MDKKEWKKHCKDVDKVSKKYPGIPTEVFDIEASDEMAMLYEDTFGIGG